LIDSVE